MIRVLIMVALVLPLTITTSNLTAADDVVRVFIFAGQSNMVGSDSKVKDIDNFPPFRGLGTPQNDVLFTYILGREDKTTSGGWVSLQPVNNVFGPELSFARKVTAAIDAPIAIIKCAAGGTHLGGDWNPDEPSGFKMYPLTLNLIRDSLAQLDEMNIRYRIEGFMWHQGENDMFNEDYMPNYGKNLKNLLACWRRDLRSPELKFYIGELCCKTIWGMDLRPRMYAISKGQRAVTTSDPLAEYIPNNHIGVEIGGGVGLHYHYGTLGQLQHGENYADAYLSSIGIKRPKQENLKRWPYKKKSTINLFVLAGHRNMEGERAFTADIETSDNHNDLLQNQPQIAFKYSLGGGVSKSSQWKPLGITGFYDTFGPELSFGKTLAAVSNENIAIAKFTHSGSQIIDWTPEGSEAKSRHIYSHFIQFIRDSITELETKGHQVRLAGVFYHVGENDMSFGPYRSNAAARIDSIIKQSREDLELADLHWFVCQQPPTDDERVNKIDVTSMIADTLAKDDDATHVRAFQLPPQAKKLVIDSEGIIQLGNILAEAYLKSRK